MAAYYNEHYLYAAQWLRNLIAAGHIAPGDVDDRSIKEVKADDLKGHNQARDDTHSHNANHRKQTYIEKVRR